jgi:hypothetical protein
MLDGFAFALAFADDHTGLVGGDDWDQVFIITITISIAIVTV